MLLCDDMKAYAIVVLAATLGLCLPGEASAKPPELKALFPAGAARGQTVEVTATGTFDPWPLRGWSSCPGAGSDKGESSYFFGFAAAEAPREVSARVEIDSGETLPVAARAPAP